MYIDAYLDRQTEIVHVVERVDGKRVFKEYPADYSFYVENPNGPEKSIFGTRVSKVKCRTSQDLRREKGVYSNKRTFESDFNPVIKCLSENYKGQEPPKANVCFFDIEVDFIPEQGFSEPSDPFAPVTAITVWLSQYDALFTIAVPPKGMSVESAQRIGDSIAKEEVFIVPTEKQLLDMFLDIIQDSDYLSGWNSEGYDVPYLVNRIKNVLGSKDAKRFNLWDQNPRKKTYERFGKEQTTYDFIGRVHLDYLDLYRRYTYHELHSYSLDNVSQIELGDQKVPYEGTLDQLYNQDFKKFLEYNRQDVMLIVRMDRSLGYLDLFCTIAHDNTVPLLSAKGAVALSEQGIINKAHENGLRVPDKDRRDDGGSAVGAWVAKPKKGIHKDVGSVDINSLYPSVLRSLNISPETIVGQLRPVLTEAMITQLANGKSLAQAWDDKFSTVEYEEVMKYSNVNIIIDWETGESQEMPASKVHDIIFNEENNLMITANGTIINGEHEGIIPLVLRQWYAERKELQATLRRFETIRDNGIELPERFR